ncbi:MAG: response regulator [Solirubrobacterales bacterium]
MAETNGDGAVVKIVLVDDHAVVRSALRALLEKETDFEVLAEASDGGEAVRFAMGHRPDVVVLDLNMPGVAGLDAIAPIRERCPETQVVVLTMQNQPGYARQALQAGAVGYVLKEAADSELVRAVRLAAEGQTYLQPEVGARLAAEGDSPDNLSERELEVLKLIALGHTNGEIADDLVLSVRTVESHRAHIQQKLGRTTRAELVRYSLDRGLIET